MVERRELLTVGPVRAEVIRKTLGGGSSGGRLKNLDRLDLISRIGDVLQRRMTYADIDAYLPGFGIDTSKPWEGTNSKWVYVKHLLADASEETVLTIADELDIPHGYALTPTRDAVEATFWEPFHFRLFLSHLSSFKKTAAALQASLRPFGISSFVAHVDIEPTKEWLEQIEAGLLSMDALVAILMPGFRESGWTDQEVGVAVGRGVLVVPIIRGLDPYGFIGRYQGIQAGGRTVREVAGDVFTALTRSRKTHSRILTCLVDTMLQTGAKSDALAKLQHLATVDDLPEAYLERLREGAATSAVFAKGQALDELNRFLLARGLREVGAPGQGAALDDDIPF